MNRKTAGIWMAWAGWMLTFAQSAWSAPAANLRAEIRGSLSAILEQSVQTGQLSGAFWSTLEGERSLERLVRTYRMDRGNAPLSILRAPYVPFLLQEKLGEIYPALYDENFAREYERLVAHPQPSTLMDALLDAYLSKSLPPELEKQASAVGPCLAKRVLKAAGSSCELDESSALPAHKPGVLKLALLRFECPLIPLHSACQARRSLFDYLKKDLLAARDNPDVRAIFDREFQKRFPQIFKASFLKEMSTRMATFGTLVSQKFGSAVDPLWSDRTPLVEGEGASPADVSLQSFAESLRVESLLAAYFASPERKTESARALAAPLLYAAANRLLVLTGVTGADWNGTAFEEIPGTADATGSEGDPKRPPVLKTRRYGGWALESSASGALSFKLWDWGNYDPTRAEAPSPYLWFADRFRVGFAGEPQLYSAASQRLESTAELLSALSAFLRVTRADGPFAKHFGDLQELPKILDPASPLLYPRDGRKLAIGVAAGVLKNWIAPEFGHIKIDPAVGLGIEFFDPSTPQGRGGEQPQTKAISRALLAASDLKATLEGDSDVPEELQALAPSLSSALQIGALALGADGQEPAGRFKERMKSEDGLPSSLATQLQALRALTRAYSKTETLLVLFRLKGAWVALDREFGQTLDQLAGTAGPLVPGAATIWSLLSLWDESQASVRKQLDPEKAPEISWQAWDSRMGRLRNRLLASYGWTF